jgi:probable HAF family extracellular repeat protein
MKSAGWTTTLLLGFAAGAVAQTEYHMTIVDPFPWNGSSQATGINSAGTIAGDSGGTGGFIGPVMANSGNVTNLNGPGYFGSFNHASGINNSGVTVGYAYTSTSTTHAYKWTGGVGTDLGAPGGLQSWGVSINSGGDIVGGYSYHYSAQQPTLTANNGVVWHANGTTTILNSGSTYLGSSVGISGINDSGLVVGAYHDSANFIDVAATWAPGKSMPTKVAGLNTTYNSAVHATNNLGDLIGSYEDASYQYYEGNFVILGGNQVNIGNIGGVTEVGAINDNRQIIGTAVDGSGAGHPFVWSAATGIETLDNHLDNSSLGRLLEVSAINNNGVMAGIMEDSNANYYLVQIAAVPEPAGLVILALAPALLLKRKR